MKTKEEMENRAFGLKLYEIELGIIKNMVVGLTYFLEVFDNDKIPIFMNKIVYELGKEFNVMYKNKGLYTELWIRW